ncbi:MAG: Holliday junction branch migration protein RuvA [Syntrophomonadaceae bacterium]|jgi:Holliday junction DNA helicase RuvA
MIAFIRGIVSSIGEDSIVVEANGIGYLIYVHSRAFSQMPGVGREILVHTHLQVLENDMRIFGFLNKQELSMFKILIGISGMGAKTALSVLGVMEPATFYNAILDGDEKLLTGIPGIGKKSAQRLMLELKDKVPKSVAAGNQEQSSHLGEAVEALEALGYSAAEVIPVLTELREKGQLGDNVGEAVKKALKLLALQTIGRR